MFWKLFLIVAILLSVAVVNPVPLIAAALLVAVGKTAEAPLVAEVEAAGGNPDLPQPTSVIGCIALVMALIAFGLLLLIGLGAVATILEGVTA